MQKVHNFFSVVPCARKLSQGNRLLIAKENMIKMRKIVVIKIRCFSAGAPGFSHVFESCEKQTLMCRDHTLYVYC